MALQRLNALTEGSVHDTIWEPSKAAAHSGGGRPTEPAVVTALNLSHPSPSAEEGVPAKPIDSTVTVENQKHNRQTPSGGHSGSILRKPQAIVVSRVTASGFDPVPDSSVATLAPPEPVVVVDSRANLKLSDTGQIRHQAATKVQAVFRGNRGRRRTQSIIAERNKPSFERRKSIVKFQNATRMSMWGTSVENERKRREEKRVHAVTMGAPEVKATYELFRSMELFEGVDVESILQLAVQAKKIEVEGECDDDDDHN